ncbi:MAG: hypothetical protein Q4E63_07575 [Prevotellaceae bacterium]|nr:hypothetical protein [Prevotellaceae bacterium]
MKKQKNRTYSGRMSEQMALLEFLKERSGVRQSKLEAYLDLVDKASVQYIPKDLCRQEFILSDGQFVITITELADCWHWHRATVRTFIEQLEEMHLIEVKRLPKSQVITFPALAATSFTSPIDEALVEFRQKMESALSEWRSGKMSATDCAVICERHYSQAVTHAADLLKDYMSGNPIGKIPFGGDIPESVERAFCKEALSVICEATLQRVLGDDESKGNSLSLLPFFYKDLGGDWLSFIEAAVAIAELAIDGRSPALQHESAAIKSQFQSLCRPFLVVASMRLKPDSADSETLSLSENKSAL